jgi:signal transduction histidine kinase
MLARFRPRPLGIAARIALTVVAALVLTQVVSAVVYLTDRAAGGPPVRPFEVVQRIAGIVAIADATPQARRPRVVQAVDAPGLSVSLRKGRPSLEDRRGFPYDALRDRLRSELADPGRPVLVNAGRDPSSRRVLTVAVSLEDASWLVFTADGDRAGPFRLLRFGLSMLLIAAVVAVVSWWAARRLTAPIAAFARAAERLGVEGEVRLLPEEGPRELRSATRAFNRMQERLRRYVDDRTQMLAAISHDLRTPLTRLRLRAEFVEDPDQQRRMMADLDEMEAMIASTLAFARDDARREPRTRIDLAALLESMADDLADAGRQVGYEGPRQRIVSARPVALRRAVGNLLDNALKYAGAARLRLEEGQGKVVVSVEDRGPGIPEAEMEAVFAPFYRIERSRSRDTGGAGLGLSIARTVARAHGGDVVLENRAGGGLRASLVLPLEAEEARKG